LAAIQAHFASIAYDDSGVRQIALTLSATFRFRAGQYLTVVHPGGARIPMSIASAPELLPRLELHYRPLPGVPEAALMDELLDAAANGSHDVLIDGPFGDVFVHGPTQDNLLLIAGGSGIAQCRSILTHLRSVRQARDVHLLWSVTAADQLYCDDELRDFATWLHYAPLIDTPNAENAAVVWLRQSAAPDRGRIIISGGPGFVYAVVDALDEIRTTGASVESDVFSYAPRR
jgi:CDP-4-dehydro-6-deoxyglucose reductase